MTKDKACAELEEELSTLLSSDFSRVAVSDKPNENGMRYIFIHPRRLLTHDEVVSKCSNVAPLIRQKIPEKLDGWAAGVLVERIFGDPMGIYFLGWQGHADQWRFSEPPTDHADWLTLFELLGKLLAVHSGEDREVQEDYFLRDRDNGLPKLTVRINRIEFVTPHLLADIQELLSNGYADWSVEMKLFLSPPFEQIPAEGIEIWLDEIIEHWHRPRLKQILGDRLKI